MPVIGMAPDALAGFATLLSAAAALFVAPPEPSGADDPIADPTTMLQQIVRQASSLLWTTDTDLRIVQIVSGIPWLEGTINSYAGRTVPDIAQELGMDERPEDAHLAALEGEDVVYEGGMWGNWLELRASPLRNAAGEIVGVAGSAQDITRRKQVEDALRRTRLELEVRVDQRTAELAEANEQLKRIIQRTRRAEKQRRRSEQLYRGLVESQDAMIVRVDTEGYFTFVNDAYCRKFGKSRHELLGAQFQLLVHPDDLPATLTAMEKLYEPPYRVTLEQRALTVDGWRWLAWEDTALRNKDGVVVEIQAIGRDITDHVEMHNAEHEQRTLAEALIDTAAALNSTLNLDVVLDRILDNIRRVVDHDTANVMLIEDGGLVHIVRARGYSQLDTDEHVTSLTFFLHDVPVYERIEDTARPVVIDDAQHDADWRTFGGSLRWIRSFVGAPIRVEGEVIGFLNLDSSEPGAFTRHHAERLTAFADQAGIAIRNARLYQQAQDLAVMEERNTIARDLHDSVNQTLFSAKVIAESLPRLMDEDPALVRKNLIELQHLTSGALAQMRTMLVELRPRELRRAGLQQLLQQLVDAFRGRTPARITLEVDGQCEVPVEPRLMLYRIAQEALNNIARHASPTRVTVMLRCRDDGVQISIEDDGYGFDEEHVEVGSLGLQIMRERAASIGADLHISSVPGQGTKVTVQWEPGMRDGR